MNWTFPTKIIIHEQKKNIIYQLCIPFNSTIALPVFFALFIILIKGRGMYATWSRNASSY